MPARYQLDLCDEIGLMIYEESYAGWFLQDSPKMAERFDREVSGDDPPRPEPSERRDVGPAERDARRPGVPPRRGDAAAGPRAGRHPRGDAQQRPLRQSTGGAASMAGISFWQSRGSPGAERHLQRHQGRDQRPGHHLGAGPSGLAPGPHGEYGVVRWTAPAAGEYTVSGTFTGIAEQATTDVHVLHNGKPLFDGLINLDSGGNEASFSRTISAARPATRSTSPWAAATGATAADTHRRLRSRIQSADGKTYDAAARVLPEPRTPTAPGATASSNRADSRCLDVPAASQGETTGATASGSAASPIPARGWEDVLSDQHPYQRVPHTAGDHPRACGRPWRRQAPVFISEYGIGSSVDLCDDDPPLRATRRRATAKTPSGIASGSTVPGRLEALELDDTFASPEDFFAPVPGQHGRPAAARAQRDPRQSERASATA